MINLGVIGTGFGSKVHVPGFQKIHGIQVLGIAGKSLEKTKSIASKHGIPLAFSSWKELILHPEIHAVSIATPPAVQKEIAIFAARHGKHLFCEKPLAMSAAEARSILRVAKKAKIVHAIDFEFRNTPGIVTLQKLLAKKTIGNIRHANIFWLTGGRAAQSLPLGWQNKKRAGGGTLFAFGSHVVDYTEMLFGRIKTVSARLSVAKKNGASAEDTCDMIFSILRGPTINVSISNVLLNGSGHSIEVYGDEGSLKLINTDPGNPKSQFKLLHFSQKSGKETPLSIPVSKKMSGIDSRLSMFLGIAKDFISAIRRRKDVVPSLAEGLRAQVVLDAIRKSHRTGKLVSIPRG